MPSIVKDNLYDAWLFLTRQQSLPKHLQGHPAIMISFFKEGETKEGGFLASFSDIT